MDNAELKEFIEYYCKYKHNGRIETIGHMYEKFGREFIFDIPVEYRDAHVDKYLTIQGTHWAHSTTEPACYYRGKSLFYILGWSLTLDEWLPYSALSSEERTLFRLKYG